MTPHASQVEPSTVLGSDVAGPGASTNRAIDIARQAHRRRRDAICLCLDLTVLAGAFVFAFLIRYEGHVPIRMVEVMLWTLPWVAFLQYALVPASVVVCDAALAMLGVAGIRCVRRLQRQHRRTVEESRRGPRGTPTVLIGAGVGGRLLLQELAEHGDLGYQPVAFVDDDEEKAGRVVGGVRVLGTTADLPAIAARFSAKVALITIPSAGGREINRIVDRCKAAGMQTKIVPHLYEIVSGRVRISQLRDVAIEDLLGRDPVVIENSAAPAVVEGRVVMVTGAGGSIGSELCRQLLHLRPSRLLLVERTENSLYEIHRELTAGDSGDRVVPELADVCDAERMTELFASHRPHLVFHAAAHKHVPMMERVPCEAIKN